MQPMWIVGEQATVVFGGAAYDTVMLDVVRPRGLPAATTQPLIVQWGSLVSSMGRDSSQSVSWLSWLTAATRAPWRAALVTWVYAQTARPMSMKATPRNTRSGKTRANSTSVWPRS